MKKILLLLFAGTIFSCGTTNNLSTIVQEEQMIVTRKYIGNFIEYYHTSPDLVGGEDLIWIRTSVFNTFGRISAYSKTCKFSPGEKIYLKPTSSTPDNFGYWEYQIENDDSVSYKISDYRFENNAFVHTRSL
jgi:hypothetical protein